jgi:hypothetical protein
MAYRFLKVGTEVKLEVAGRVVHGIVTTVTSQDVIVARVGRIGGYAGARSVTHPNRFVGTAP